MFRSVVPTSRIITSCVIPRRFKTKVHWAKLARQVTSTQKALNYFDDLYGNVFGKDWPSIRVALLTQSKYVAVVNNFSDVERIVPSLENLGAMDIRRLLEYRMEQISARPSKRKKETKSCERNYSRNIGETMDDFADNLRSDELRSIYPENTDIPEHVESISSKTDMSNRIIDPSVGADVRGLYEFIPATTLKGKEDWVPESDHFRYYATDDQFSVHVEEQSNLSFPSELKIFSFMTGCCDSFPRPEKSPTLQVTDYYLMDGASILPVLALDLRPGDNFLDMCAAPGGKSLIALQTLYLNRLTCNDVSLSRLKRVRNVMNEFVFNFDEKWDNESICITNLDGRHLEDADVYNKILVDVPCTTDRHSVMEDDNNIFNGARVAERIKIPELQSSLLATALKLVKVGGYVVYSTCSLSPIQNDGVVHMAIKTVSQQTSRQIAVIDMSKALEPTKIMFKYRSKVLKYGHLVVPYLPNNYGPMYFCKLMRLS